MRAKFFRAFARAKRGNIATITAICAPLLIGIAGLVAEYGDGLLVQVQSQRAADLAAYEGALAYSSTSSTSSMTSAADSIGTMNGLTSGNLTVALVSSPTGDGNNAVEVTVSQSVPLVLSAVLKSGSSQNVSATSYAEITPNTAGCIVALSATGTGVTVTSASGITADSCAVESDNTVTASSASNITTIQVDYDSSTPPSATSASTIGPPTGKTLTETKEAVSDPFAGNSEVSTARARLASVEALTSPAAPTVPAGNNLTYSSSTFTGTLPAGCSNSHSGSTWTLTCPSGTIDIGSLTVSSTATLTVATTGSSANTFNFHGAISLTSIGTLTMPAGTYNILNGILISSSSAGTFGAGTFNVGPGTTACTDGGDYSFCVESATNLTIGGPSTFVLSGGIYAGSSATIKLGSGTTNSYDIGESSNGNGATAASSSNLLFADATGSGDLFEVVGNITAASAGCLATPDAAEHDVNGAVIANSASNTTLGSGIWTIADYLDNESASGGSGCSGWSGGTADTGVTLVLGGVSTISSGTCSGDVICVLSASSASMVAPTTGPTAGFVVIGPATGSAGATFEAASSGSFSGVVYLPNGPINVSSASGLGGGSGACLELIAAQVTVTSASATGSTCTGTGQATGALVKLVQ